MKQLSNLKDKLRRELEQDFSGICVDNVENLPAAARIHIKTQSAVGAEQLAFIDLSCSGNSGALFKRMMQPKWNGGAHAGYYAVSREV